MSALILPVAMIINFWLWYNIGWLHYQRRTSRRIRKLMLALDVGEEKLTHEEFVHKMLDIYFMKGDEPWGIRLADKIYDYFHQPKKVEVKDGTE
jgi:hypothetical protein